ncbi:uncharacterized protein BYT42DRAFT_616221 [Radiomyces spectabilis]|uniref:uncharacterized protein n=1 Tax=Radiomyces spectabilis TaxID=64574 RepID=UPI00222097F9|nr:uncharacterized protein BYT42DRAFT_616221 [Radiomyces spectabilis]KAI8373033.1 hypothetical protein BYT42DRAFT_616221 [Radiomyces spectabilis]
MSEHSRGALSDSDLSLQLSDGSTLSSDSEHSDADYERTDHGRKTGAKPSNQTKTKTDKTIKRRGKKNISLKLQPPTPNPPSQHTKPKTEAKSAKDRKKNPHPPMPKERKRSIAKNHHDNNEELYCICRKGYDGKEFMVACDGCQEWFHGRCVGMTPKKVTGNYFCQKCTLAKAAESEAAPPPTPTPPRNTITIPAAAATSASSKGKKAKGRGNNKKTNNVTSHPKKSATTNNRKKAATPPEAVLPSPPLTMEPPKSVTVTPVDEEDEEDLDDICPVCESECTCGTATATAKKSTTTTSVTVEKPTETANSTDIWAINDTSAAVVRPSANTKKADVDVANPHVVERVGVDVSQKPSESKAQRKAKKTKKVPKRPSKSNGTTSQPLASRKALSALSKVRRGSQGSDEEEVNVDDVDDEDTMDDVALFKQERPDDDDSDADSVSDPDDENDRDDAEEIKNDAHSVGNDSEMSPFSGSYSSVHIDSGDDEDIEKEEERALIEEFEEEDDDDLGDLDNDEDSDLEGIDENELYSVGDQEEVDDDDDVEEEIYNLGPDGDFDDEYYVQVSSRWNSSEDEDEEEDDEEDIDIRFHDDDHGLDTVDDPERSLGQHESLPFADDHTNLFDSIAAAFLQVLAPLADMPLDDVVMEPPAIDATHVLGGDDLDMSHSFLPDVMGSSTNVDPGPSDANDTAATTPAAADDANMEASMANSQENTKTSNTVSSSLTNNPLEALSLLVSNDPMALPLTTKKSDDMSGAQAKEANDVLQTLTSSAALLPSVSLATTETTMDPSGLSCAGSSSSSSSTTANNLSLTQDQLLELLKICSSAALHPEKSMSAPATPCGGYGDPLSSSSSSLAFPLSSSSIPGSVSPSTKKPFAPIPTNSRQILPKPTANPLSASNGSPLSINTLSHRLGNLATDMNLTTEQLDPDPSLGFQDLVRKRSLMDPPSKNKRRRRPSGNSFTGLALANHSTFSSFYDGISTASTEPTISSSPCSPTAETEPVPVSMDELVDTSQLYTRSSSRSPSPDPDELESRFSRDLSRWQRVPIGAFRLLRSKNRLWLDR